MENSQIFNFLDYYLMGVVFAAFLIFILDKYFMDLVEKEIKKDIPDAKPGKNGKMFEQIDYLFMAALSWLAVAGLLLDMSRYIFIERKKK